MGVQWSIEDFMGPDGGSNVTTSSTSRESQPRPGQVQRTKINYGATNRITPSSPPPFRPGEPPKSPRPNGTAHPIPIAQANNQSASNNHLAVQSAPPKLVADPSCAELEALRHEVQLLRKELARSRDTINRLQERDKVMKDRLSEQALKQLEKGTKFEDLNLGENRPTQLIRRYGNLYSQMRVDTLDALDSLPEVSEFDDLKAKLLFSVVVLSSRSVKQTIHDLRNQIRTLLYMYNPSESDRRAADPLVKELEENIEIYLRKTVDKYDITPNVEAVRNQIYTTLYDYPSLKKCEELKLYMEECVRLSWAFSVQNPILYVDYETKDFREDMHTRFHTSEPDSTDIQSVLWPALLEENGTCLYKGVVVT